MPNRLSEWPEGTALLLSGLTQRTSFAGKRHAYLLYLAF